MRGTGETLPQQDDSTTTVVARITASGVAIGKDNVWRKRLAWSVGRAIEKAWVAETRSPPTKANTVKSNGNGSHCHARYPISWSKKIDDVIKLHAGCDTPQLSLALG
jgi:hypothetical protein